VIGDIFLLFFGGQSGSVSSEESLACQEGFEPPTCGLEAHDFARNERFLQQQGLFYSNRRILQQQTTIKRV